MESIGVSYQEFYGILTLIALEYNTEVKDRAERADISLSSAYVSFCIWKLFKYSANQHKLPKNSANLFHQYDRNKKILIFKILIYYRVIKSKKIYWVHFHEYN